MSLKCFSHPTYLNTFNFPKELSLSTILHAILHATHFINKISFLLFSVPQTSSVDWDIHNRTACGNCLWTVAFLIWYQLTTFIHMHRFFFALFSSGQGSISREHRKKMYFFMPLVLPNAGSKSHGKGAFHIGMFERKLLQVSRLLLLPSRERILRVLGRRTHQGKGTWWEVCWGWILGAHLKGWLVHLYFTDSTRVRSVTPVTGAHPWCGWSCNLPSSARWASPMPSAYARFPSCLGSTSLRQSWAHDLLATQQEDTFCAWILLCPVQLTLCEQPVTVLHLIRPQGLCKPQRKAGFQRRKDPWYLS